MKLRKESEVKKGFCGFDRLEPEHPKRPFPMQLREEWITGLVKYMQRFGYKLGYDFFFEMGYDAPSRQFNAALPGRSVMVWKEKDEDGVMQTARVDVIDCIIQLQEDEARKVELEKWEDVEESGKPKASIGKP